MRRFSYLCRLALTLVALSFASIASAELQRYPQAEPLPPTPAEVADKVAAENFMSFYNSMRSANPNTNLEGVADLPQLGLRQRPAKIMRTAWDPTKELFVVVPNFNGMNGYGDAYYGKLDVESSIIDPLYRNAMFTNAEEAYMQTGVVRDGILYIPKMLFNTVTMEGSVIWNRFDIFTGQALSPIKFGSDANAYKMFCYSLTYDPVNDVIYGLTYDNNTGLGGGLIHIDCSKPEDQWIAESYYDSNNSLFNVGGTSADWMAGICFNPLSQKLYGLTSNGELKEIDLKKCMTITLREYDYSDEDFCFPPVMQSTPMAYSPYDKSILFISFNNATGNSTIASIDTDEESWDAYYLNGFRTQLMASTLYCPDPFADDDAPGVMAVPALTFAPGSVSGKISVTAPSTYFNGIALESSVKMTLHVLSNNKEIYSSTVTPGQNVEFDTTLEQGLNNIIAYCSIGDLNGAQSQARLWIGYDQPLPPTNLKYVGGILSWKAPKEEGVHNAYIDLSDAAYDVYIDGNKQNTAPINGTSYPLPYNEKADGRKNITVTVTSNGVTSAHSEPVSRVLGRGYDLPLTITPTQAEASLFDTINLNGGDSKWQYQEQDNLKCYNVYTLDYTKKPNDWLMLPPLYFDSAEAIYNFSVDYVNAYHSDIQKDNLEIYIGTDPVPEAMTKLIYSHYERIQPTITLLDVRFSVPEAGTYYIGIYCKPGDDNYYRGVQLNNFRIAKTSVSTAVPAAATGVKLTPASYGDLVVTVEGEFPTVDMAGNPLDPNEELTMEFLTDGDKTQVTGLPGTKASGMINVNKDGFADIYVTVGNSAGAGLKTYYSVYAGYDIPTPPANVKYLIDSDNMGMLVSWDPANEVGEHGGYVDPDEVTYDFYTQSSAGAEILGTAGKQTSYHYTVNSNLQSRYYVGPVAVNSMGTSINGIFITETLGTPYKTPAKEDFGYTAFALSKWLYDTNAPFKGVTWEHCSEPDPAFATQIDFTNGGSFRATGTGLGQLIAPRISTKNDDRVKLKTRYWNYANAGKIEIWGKTYQNQEFRKVAEVEPSRPANGEWVEWGAVLPYDFGHQDWIQLNVRVNLAPGQNVILDTYEVAQNIDIDFQASSISTPYSAFIGENPSFNVVVTNAGSEPARGSVTVELLGDGEVLASRNADIDRIRPGENYEMPVSFYMDQSYINYDMLEIHAKASADGDENSRNDNCYASFLHYDNTLPIVRDLTATRSDNEQDVKLNWSEPKAISNGIESAENYCPFVNVEKIGEWTNVDIDGKEPFTISNKRWTGDSNPSSWVVFDAQEMATMSEDRLSPRSGNQMFMARSCAYVESEQPTRAMDFLISPEVKGGSKVGFWINTLSSTYSETVAIWYSTTDITLNAADVLLTERDVIPRECGSFKWLKNFTKSGSELWEYCEVTLPEDAKYFAFVYSSFGMFGAMIDDITYSPVNPVTLKPDTYNILASYANSNPVPVKFDVPSAGEYVLSNADGRETTYYVVGNYIDGDHTFSAPLSNPAKVTATGVDMIGADLYVRGGKGVIVIGGAAGMKCTLSDLEGKVLANRTVSSAREEIRIDAGIYLVTLGSNTVKVIVR